MAGHFNNIGAPFDDTLGTEGWPATLSLMKAPTAWWEVYLLSHHDGPLWKNTAQESTRLRKREDIWY